MSSKVENTEIDNTYSEMVNTPLVNPVLRVAVAGSRRIDPAVQSAIKDQLKNVYKIIDNINKTIPEAEQASKIYSNSTVKVRLLSSLAEGADRLAISPELMDFDYELAAVLPFSQSVYCRDFMPKKSLDSDYEGSVVNKEEGTVGEFTALIDTIVSSVNKEKDAPIIELDGDHDCKLAREEAYKNCSDVLVNHCDILIAIYNGDDTEDTGTAATVNAAKKQRVPVLIISDKNPNDMHLVDYQKAHFVSDTNPVPSLEFLAKSLEQEIHNILLFSRFFDQMDEKDKEHKRIDSSWISKLCNAFVNIFRKPKEHKTNKDHFFERVQRYNGGEKLSYLYEEKSDFNYQGPIELKKKYNTIFSRLFKIFTNIFSSESEIENLIKEKELDFEMPPQEKIDANNYGLSTHRYYATFLRADRLANYYSYLHRSSFLLIYILAGLALIIAALAIAVAMTKEIEILGFILNAKELKALGLILGLAELAALFGIYKLYSNDHDDDYHARWLEYRCLAEFLRPMIYLSMIGKNYRIRDLRHPADYIGRNYVGHKSIARSWLYIYMQTIVRWSGFSHCKSYGENKTKTISFINQRWLNNQIQYHINNTAKMSVISKKLEKISTTLFYLTAFAVSIKIIATSFKLVATGFSDNALYWLSLMSITAVFCAAIFPIVAATVFSVRNHAEFDISSQRSLSMRAKLITHYEIIAEKIKENESVIEVHHELHQTASKTIEEAAEWLEIYEIKEAELG